MSSPYERIADMPLHVESLELEGLELKFSEEFVRLTTLVKLSGAGHTGIGEDVTYDGLDHVAFRAEAAALDLAGSYTLDSFSSHLEEVELWPAPPVRETSRNFRRWAFESAALDLALRQAGSSLADVLGREARPVNFVVSMRLGALGAEGPETADRALQLLERYPGTRLKLDPTNAWTRELVDELVATGAVASVDFKGLYRGTPVDVETDPDLYRMVIEAFPEAWIEDPDVNEETRPILEPMRDRVTWDAPIHSVADVLERPWEPRMVNIKPSRFGSLRSLFEMYDWCEREGVGAYGGGQTELGAGRGQIQYLASLFHPDTPNDTAPSGYNEPRTPDGLPRSPLEPRLAATGFRWQN
jgi:L-alanine-DL-glutamate epimerase-like enolase superfamily enzyme